MRQSLDRFEAVDGILGFLAIVLTFCFPRLMKWINRRYPPPPKHPDDWYAQQRPSTRFLRRIWRRWEPGGHHELSLEEGYKSAVDEYNEMHPDDDNEWTVHDLKKKMRGRNLDFVKYPNPAKLSRHHFRRRLKITLIFLLVAIDLAILVALRVAYGIDVLRLIVDVFFRYMLNFF